MAITDKIIAVFVVIMLVTTIVMSTQIGDKISYDKIEYDKNKEELKVYVNNSYGEIKITDVIQLTNDAEKEYKDKKDKDKITYKTIVRE